MLAAADRAGVKYVSLFVFSTENWQRAVAEVGYLMELVLTYFKNDHQRLLEANYRIRFVGRFDDRVKPEIKKGHQRGRGSIRG